MKKSFTPLIAPVAGSRRKYTKPKAEILPLTEVALNYLTVTRKLKPETLDAFGVGCTKKGTIAIPYLDESSERQLVKFRHQTGGLLKLNHDDGTESDVKTYIEPGGKGILLGSNLADPGEGPLIISFGDYDAMSVYQAGLPNAVSLPFGDGGFEFIDLQWTFIQKFKEIIFFPDIDEYPNLEAKLRAETKREELYMRLGKDRCKTVSFADREGAKDANALLVKGGPDAVRAAVENADWVPEEYLVRVVDAIDKPLEPGIPFGFSIIDRTTGGITAKDLILVAGDSQAGKTTITLNFIARFIKKRLPVFFWTGEQDRLAIRSWFERIVAGPGRLITVVDPDTEKLRYFPRDELKPFIREWYGDLFWQYEISPTKEKFFEVAELAVKRHGVKVVVIDNLMAFTGGEGESYYQAQGDFAQSCKMFAAMWSVTVILICHNRKVPDMYQGRMRFPTKDDVEGSKKVTNWADILFQMYKKPEGIDAGEWAQTDGFICLAKLREGGKGGAVPICIDEQSNRIVQVKDKGHQFEYGWEDLARSAK